jgi:hypothetical protein
VGLVVARRFALKIAGTLSVALAWTVIGCGGGGAPETGAPATAHDKKSASAKAPSASSSEEDEEEDEAPTATTPCADGTCTTCGKGICPAGFYCDESAKGGAACSWLPQCGEKASCSCLTKALGSACKCADQAGGQHVTCD